MVEPPPHDEPAGPPELTDAPLRGASLWELAQEGSRRSPPTPDTSAVDAMAARRRFTLRTVGVIGVVGVVTVVTLVATVTTPVSRAAGGGGASASGSVTRAPAVSPLATSASACSAEPSDPAPSVGKTVEILVSHVPIGTEVTLDLTFPGGSAQYSATAGSGGVADVSVAVIGDRPAQPVDVSVTAGASSCRTTFTPTEPVKG
jgi:hypothetical protein